MSIYLEKGTTATVNPPRGQTILGVNSGITQNTQILVIQPEVLAAYYNAQLLEDYKSGVLTELEYNTIITNQTTTRVLWEINTNYSQDKQPLIDLIVNNNFPITTAGKTSPQLVSDINTHGYQVVIIPTPTPVVATPVPYVDGTYQNFTPEATNTAIEFKASDGSVQQVQHINTIEAVQNNDGIRIQLLAGGTTVVNKVNLNECYINGALVTQVLATAIIELNSLFVNAGGAIGLLPVITSTSTILLTAGNNINHTVTGTNIVSVDFDISTTGTVPTGNITQVDFERRKIIGGSSLAAGTYNIIATAYNYFGQVSQTIQLIVSAAFTNTYSFEAGSGVATYNAGTINSVPLYRPADGTGASDAWSIMCWYKMKTAHKYDFNYAWGFGYLYGGTGCVAFQHRYNTLKMYFGVNTQYITISCTKPHGYDDWHCCLITYTGNSTGTSTVNAGNQFNIYIDGVLMTSATNGLTVTQNAGTNGYTGAIEKATNSHAVDMCIGGLCSVTGTVKNSDTDPVDEVSIWASELSATDAVTLYNSGTPLDLALFSPTYNNWWRNGDNGDIASFPLLNDMNSSGCDLTVAGGSVANYISDVP